MIDVLSEFPGRAAEIGKDSIDAVQAGAGHKSDIEWRSAQGRKRDLIELGKINAARHVKLRLQGRGRGVKCRPELGDDRRPFGNRDA